MGNLRGNDLRGLAWTIAGASAGGLVRQWLAPLWPSASRSAAGTFVLAAVSAVIVGFAVVAPIRAPLKTVLVAAGGAAGSVGAAAAGAAVSTPVESAFGVAVFFVGAVAGAMTGMYVAARGANHEAEERASR